ncbi:MAG: autotransporter-associated beta strand repeat-containing protein, partial [Planctomycetia bacterium]
MRDERAVGIAVRWGAARSGAGPRGTTSKLWGSQTIAVIALLTLTIVGLTSRRAEAQLVVNSNTTISSGTNVSSVEIGNGSTLSVPAGSSLNSSGSIFASPSMVSGTGTLRVSGGRVTSGGGILGQNMYSVGAATVLSGTWANSGDLTVGGDGTGTLTMTGGLVRVGGTLSRGSAGTINLNAGGTLQIGTGATGGVLLGGTGALTNNGTLILNRSDAYTHSGVLSGSGAVVKQGAGTLTLSGTNTYTGGTTLTAGTLAFGSANAIGSSGTISFGGGTLQSSASNTTDYSARFSNAASQQYKIDTNGQSVTLASNLTSSGGSFTKLGTGTVTLSGANTYTGGTTLTAGTLALGSANAIGSAGTISFGGGTLQSTVSNTTDYSARFSNAASQQYKIDTN